MIISNYTRRNLLVVLHDHEGGNKDDVLRFIKYLESYTPSSGEYRNSSVSFNIAVHVRGIVSYRIWHLIYCNGIWGEPDEIYEH